MPETPEEQKYYETWGVNPRQAVAKGHWLWSIWYHVTDPTWMWVVHGGILVAMLLFAIGCCTRIMGVLTWLGMISYIQRAPTSLFGLDTMMLLAVTYLNIGPSGAALSVDRLIQRYRATRQALRHGKRPPVFGPPEPSVSANLVLRLMQVNVCIIYLASGLTKLQGGVWWSGVAVWGTMANYEFSPMNNRFYWAMLRLISNHRWLWETVVTGETYFSLVFEISFAFLIWSRRLRWTMIIAAVVMHLGIAVCMGLVTFSMMMLVLVLSYVPAQTVREFLGWLGRGSSGLHLARLDGQRDERNAGSAAGRPARVSALVRPS